MNKTVINLFSLIAMFSLASCGGEGTPSVSNTSNKDTSIDVSSIENTSEEVSSEKVTSEDSEEETTKEPMSETSEEVSEDTSETTSESVSYLITESDWNDIVNNGSMTNRSSNYTCVMNKSLREIENTSTSTFYVDGGNLQRSYPASFDPTLIISQIYELKEWGNPSSKYNYYTYNRAEEKWEFEELNSKFLHFYRDDLGIIIDLTYSELTYNDEKHCYECSHKKSYPSDNGIYEIYDDIEIYFENGDFKLIKYYDKGKGADFTFEYSNYGSTIVTIPNQEH